MLGAPVTALAVDHHRAGEHQPPDPGAVHRREQHGGAEVVVPDVGRQVLQVDAEPDHRRLVADGVNAVQGGAGQFPDVGLGPLGAGVERIRPVAGVDGRQQGIEHPHLMAAIQQGRRDVSADEARTAGQEDAHGRTVRAKALALTTERS